jgi:hypothetical protein
MEINGDAPLSMANLAHMKEKHVESVTENKTTTPRPLDGDGRFQ